MASAKIINFKLTAIYVDAKQNNTTSSAIEKESI